MNVKEILPDAKSVKIFRFVPISGPLFDFHPGQFAILNIPDPREQGKTHRRSYSIASSPLQKEYLELCIKINDTGTTGPLLHQMKQGDEFVIEGPYGKFLLDTATRNRIFLVGSGSGIAPLMSMIRTLTFETPEETAKKTTQKPTLIYGFRHPEDFIYQHELESYGKRLDLMPVASQPPDSWKYAKGHIQDVIATLSADAFTKSDWYLCGPPDMVRQAKELLLAKNVPGMCIKTEMYE